MLTPLIVVVMNELSYRIHKLFVGFKMVEVVHLAFQDAPEALHRAIVNTSANTGHTLPHSRFFMGSVVLVRNSAVAIGSVAFGVDQANIVQQSLVLKLAAALGSACPFICD